MSDNDTFGARPRGPSITSTSNERIRYVKSLYRTTIRKKEGLFIVEGVRLMEDALDSGAEPELVLVDEDQLKRTPRGEQLLNRLRAFDLWTVSEDVLDSLSETVSPQGVIALFRIPEAPKEPQLGAVALILDRVRDPGNAGTLLRSADASGVVKTVAFVDSVDAYAPKVVRAAMGAHFRLTILEDTRLADVQPLLGERPVYLSEMNGSKPYTDVDWTKDCALILGGEAEGAGEGATQVATETIRIPMTGTTESLNTAMAGTVILFDAARVRRAAGELPESTEPRRPKFEAPPPRRPREAPRRFEEEAPRRPFEREEYAPRSGDRRPYGSGEESYSRGEGRPWERREGRSWERRDEGRPWERRRDEESYGPRREGRPWDSRGEGRPWERREGPSYRSRDEREPFRRDEGRPRERGEGRPWERREGRPYEPRGEGRPYPPRGEGRPWERRDEERPFRSRGDERPWERRDEGRPFGPRDNRPFPPREGPPSGGGGFRGNRRDDEGGRRRPPGGPSDRPGGYRPPPPRDDEDDSEPRGPRR